MNSDPLYNTTLCGHGYLHIHIWFYIWLTLSEDLSMYYSFPATTSSNSKQGTSVISNQTVADYIIIIQLSLTLFWSIVPPGCCCIIDLVYALIRSICWESISFILHKLSNVWIPVTLTCCLISYTQRDCLMFNIDYFVFTIWHPFTIWHLFTNWHLFTIAIDILICLLAKTW